MELLRWFCVLLNWCLKPAEAATRSSHFANTYHNVTTFTPINQEELWCQRRAQRQSGVLETLVTCPLWLSHPHFGFPNQGSELS